MGVYPRLVKPNAPGAKKRLGQHFLRDTGVIDRIVRWIMPAADDVFLEIGAGDGAISSRIAPRVHRLLALEIDSDCIPRLEQALNPFPSATVVPADILHLDLPQLFSQHLEPGRKLRVAGNLPYNIATVIIEKLLHYSLPVQDMFFMVQLEVAQRIAASPCSREYGYLSVDCQHHAEVQLGFKVSPACFVPRPQVSSSMIALRPKSGNSDPAFESGFEAIAKAAFSYRRKTLANALARDPGLGGISIPLLMRAGIDGSRRAEELSVQEYEHLAQVYKSEFRVQEPEDSGRP
jgi:16S rRNA (adenine1518-N6/adenine1519-N6)-dimethyltransferase